MCFVDDLTVSVKGVSKDYLNLYMHAYRHTAYSYTHKKAIGFGICRIDCLSAFVWLVSVSCHSSQCIWLAVNGASLPPHLSSNPHHLPLCSWAGEGGAALLSLTQRDGPSATFPITLYSPPPTKTNLTLSPTLYRMHPICFYPLLFKGNIAYKIQRNL